MQQQGKRKKRKLKAGYFPFQRNLQKRLIQSFSVRLLQSFFGSTTDEDVRGMGKGISFSINFALALQRKPRASVKMQFLLDARSSEPLSICFVFDTTAWKQCRRGGGWSINLDSMLGARSCQGEENRASAPNQ